MSTASHHLANPQEDLGIVPEGPFFCPVDNFPETLDLGFLLLPQFTLLAFSAALDLS